MSYFFPSLFLSFKNPVPGMTHDNTVAGKPGSSNGLSSQDFRLDNTGTNHKIRISFPVIVTSSIGGTGVDVVTRSCLPHYVLMECLLTEQSLKLGPISANMDK